VIAGLVLASYLALGSAIALVSVAADAQTAGRRSAPSFLAAGLAFVTSVLLAGASLLALRSPDNLAITTGTEFIVAAALGAAPASLLLVLAEDAWLVLGVLRPAEEPAFLEPLHARLRPTRVLAACAVLAAFVSSAILATGLIFQLGLFLVLLPLPLLLLLMSTAALAGVVRPLVRSSGSAYCNNALAVMAIVSVANLVTVGAGALASVRLL